MYNFCKKFKKLPQDIEVTDAYWIEVFEIIMDQEGREVKKKADEIHAKSLAAMK